jgi:hypothetical protein
MQYFKSCEASYINEGRQMTSKAQVAAKKWIETQWGAEEESRAAGLLLERGVSTDSYLAGWQAAIKEVLEWADSDMKGNEGAYSCEGGCLQDLKAKFGEKEVKP